MGGKLFQKGQKRARKFRILVKYVCVNYILQLRNTDLGCKSLTLIPCRMYMLPKRLRAGT